MVGGPVLKGRRLWKELNPHRCFSSNQVVQHGDVLWSNATAHSALPRERPESKISLFAVTASSSSAMYSSSFIHSLPQESRRMCSGFGSWIRRDPPSPCVQSRSFFSVEIEKALSDCTPPSSEDSVIRLAASDASEVDTNASSHLLESDEDFDFRNFPALTSSHYQDYELPQMQVKKRVSWQIRSKLFNKDTKLTEECIPKPRGRTYDFGLGDILSSHPPPLEAGARPQGGFDTNISLDECEAAPPPKSLLRALEAGLPMSKHCNLPWDISDSDDRSDISTDEAQRPEDCLQKAP